MDNLKIGLISLGCDKNRIDSEIILGNIKGEHTIVSDPKKADVIIVNTCGFIESSKQESIDTILEMAEYKVKYNCKVLAVTGCLTQRYKKELMELMPEIDVMLGVNDYDKLNKAIEDYFNLKEKVVYLSEGSRGINEGERVLTTTTGTAYVRIAEGCDNYCTYCIIPKIRGKYRSRSIESILKEVRLLASTGVKEIILVAQDTTLYGKDIYGEKTLHKLISQISEIDEIKWIRILYCYPEEIYNELIHEIKNNNKVCKYLDIPVQHISDKILKLMGRRGRKADITEVLTKLRSEIPGMILRTSIIVGFPGETDEDFEELMDFIKLIKFDKLGVFKYSREEDTAAALMKEQVEEDIKLKREEMLMLKQMEISKKINEGKIGKIYDVIIEGFEDNSWYGRNIEMSPEIDGVVYVSSKEELMVGNFVKVKITESLEYDLIGDVYYESC